VLAGHSQQRFSRTPPSITYRFSCIEQIDRSIVSVAGSANELAAGCTQMGGASVELTQAAL
tara:strand:+ start:1990 stop:2172 length:183 start_codon:yes stop_codon:yes gene_type:complete